MDIPSNQQRDGVKQISPPWLCTGVNERYVYNLGLADDVLLEKMNQAMRAHMPGLGTPSALPIIGLDRLLSKGPLESNASFARRLTFSYDAWQHAGSRFAVMSQAMTYVAGFAITNVNQVPRCVDVSASASGTYATWDTYFNTDDILKAPNHQRVTTTNWNWDGQYLWWRAWLVMFFDAGSILGPEDVWGNSDSWGDAGGSWGFNIDASFFTTFRILIRLWKSANTYYPWFIFGFVAGNGAPGSAYSPLSAQGSGNPDGTWGNWGKNSSGVMVASRPDTSRFVDGTAIYQNCYTPTGT